MKYRIEFEKKAVKFISKQPKPQKERLFKAIYKLPESGVYPAPRTAAARGLNRTVAARRTALPPLL